MSDKQALRPLPPPSVAAARGDIDALTALLAEGLDINATTRTQPRTCLMEACKGNSDRAVDYLIAKRADVNRRDESGMAALQYACEGESPMSIVSLVQAGCDVKTPAMGRLPIDFAGSHQLKHALLTQLIARIEDGRSCDVAGDACVALHCAAAIGDNERARSLIEPMGKRPPLVKVDVADSFGRTALHWACFLSMQNSADFLIGQGADPEARALPALDAIWGSGMWDARPRSTAAGEGKKLMPTAEGVMIGPTPLELCHNLHGARVLVKGTVDIALDRRVEDDFVGASARALAAEARVAKEVDRLKAEQGSEDLEDLKPDKDVYDIVHSTTRPVTEDMKAASQQQRQPPAGDLEDVPQPEPPLSQEEAHTLQLARALRMASASANFGEVIELQAAGADVMAVEVASGLTALHLACHFGAVDVARSLIAGGANKAAVDKYGRTCKDAVPDGSALVELFSD